MAILEDNPQVERIEADGVKELKRQHEQRKVVTPEDYDEKHTYEAHEEPVEEDAPLVVEEHVEEPVVEEPVVEEKKDENFLSSLFEKKKTEKPKTRKSKKRRHVKRS